MNMDRQADLHFAFQFGQDAVREGFDQVKAEFDAKFSGDAEALAEFERGVTHEKARQARLN